MHQALLTFAAALMTCTAKQFHVWHGELAKSADGWLSLMMTLAHQESSLDSVTNLTSYSDALDRVCSEFCKILSGHSVMPFASPDLEEQGEVCLL